ncbi:MAG: hypothetical protein ACOZF0_20950 [Thermodesulfobacteriota bacterium]
MSYISLDQLDLLLEVKRAVAEVIRAGKRPSAMELLKIVEEKVSMEARWEFAEAVRQLGNDIVSMEDSEREYLRSMMADGSVESALRGKGAPDPETVSTIDSLMRRGLIYRSSRAFADMVDFMANFRDYAPYNNMLVKLQNPSCRFYATENDWRKRFDRKLKEDARPMLILAPMHPMMAVFDLDQTEGPDLPEELTSFARFTGVWDGKWLGRMLENAERYRIRVAFKTLSSIHGGLAAFSRGQGDYKMRIVVHDRLDECSRFGVLCHEMAHIFLGHLGSDEDHWWPSRLNLNRGIAEIEAESVAYIVTSQFGLKGSSAAYISRHFQKGMVPDGVSMDLIAKVAGKVKRMANEFISVSNSKNQ